MLQYPVQLPPLSLSSKLRTDIRRPNDLPRHRFVSRSPPPPPPPLIPSNLSPSSPIFFPNSPSSKSSVHSSISSSTIEDVLAPGDFVGQGGSLQGESIRLVSIGDSPSVLDHYREPATEFQVKRRLGHGSYAVVYLVQEVLYRPQPSDDGHMPTMGMMELDSPSSPQTLYGREYAIKCLSKANLDEEDLAAQMSEVRLFILPFSFCCSLSVVGHHSPIPTFTPQYCYPSPYFRNFFVFTPSPGVCSRPRSILLSRTGPRPL